MVRSFYPWVDNAPAEGMDAAAATRTGTRAEAEADVGAGAIAGAVPGIAAGSEARGETGNGPGLGLDLTRTDGIVPHEARIAVVDDPSVAPRVSIVDPAPVREYVEAITQATYGFAREQGGSIPFMVIREVVENLIHAYFTDPVVTILPGGDTIRFSDRGPGIASKEQALEYGTTTATEAMKRYIRGVGSGLPYVLHFLEEKGGSLTIEDNLTTGTVVTMSLNPDVSRETTPEEIAFPQVSPIVPETREPELTLSDADRQILDYLVSHPNVGPKDLTVAYGASISTWSRRLADLEAKGILEKRGQKRYLTLSGRRISTLLSGR